MLPSIPVVLLTLSWLPALIRGEQSFSGTKHLSTVEEPASDHLHLQNLGNKRPPGLPGDEPGDPASEFRVRTLAGEFVYPLRGYKSSVIIHAFTNQSAFLECLWSSNESLSDLYEFLPASTELLVLSLDDSAARQVAWMREQVYRAVTYR